jgi:predicted O-methyltransferase YrrM
VVDENVKDETTQAIRDLNLIVQQDQRVDYTLLPFSDGILVVTKK